MEENTSSGRESPEKIKNDGWLTYVKLIFLIALFLTIGGLGGFSLGFTSTKKLTASNPAISPTPAPCPYVSHIKNNGYLITEKEVEGGRIAAYRLGDNFSDDPGVFAIMLDAGSLHKPVIFSVSSPDFSQDNLFQIIGKELWVVNGQTNNIDVYSYQVEKRSGNSLQLSSLIYLNSINLPKYKIGVIYSISCDEKICNITSAFHQESGCRMNLNINTRQFSNINCGGLGGDFNPEPL